MKEDENVLQTIINHLCKGLAKNFDDIFLEALKRKGYQFETLVEAEVFVRQNCSCEDDKEKEERVFFVKGVPFLFHSYRTKIHNPDLNSENFTITADYGAYSFL